MVRVCFLTRMLDEGGAQRQLATLAAHLDPAKFDVSIVTFYDGGRFCDDVRQIPHVEYVPLFKRGRWDVLPFFKSLYVQLRRLRPDVLHGYLPTANCLAVLLKPFLPGTRIVWGVRASDMDYSQYDWLSRSQHQLEVRLSRFADAILVNSQAGFEHALSLGYPQSKMRVIPNGIDVTRFKPDPAARAKTRREWAVRDDEVLVGLVGRLDPMKDHATFLTAASIVLGVQPRARFVVVGDGPEAYRRELLAQAERLGISDRVIWAGSRGDMADVYNAFDVACSSSISGEGFPNAIGEAMACGVPCVATDVGDSARIVGEVGVVVPPRDPHALAEGWRKQLDGRSEATAENVRSRIQQHFSVQRLVEQTEAVICALTDPSRPRM